MIIENNITNPPIIIMVLLDSNIASERIVPKFLKVAMFLECFELVEFIFFSRLWGFPFSWLNLEIKPKIIPTDIADKMCVISNNIPIVEFENNVIPNSTNNK